MPKALSFPVATILAVLLAGPALAQGSGTQDSGTSQATNGPATSDQPTPAPEPSPSAPVPSTLVPSTPTPSAADTNPAGASLPGVTATTNNPNLSVASIKLETGQRLSKIIGADVYGQDGKSLGKVDDLVMNNGDQVTLVVIAAGGFLGVGSKLVAFPFSRLKAEGDHLTLAGVTPEALTGMPNFQY